MDRLALELHNGGAPAEAIDILELYARTKCKPLPYSTLEHWYSIIGDERSKRLAKDALERGVKERDPRAVCKHVRSFTCVHAVCV
jgi:hypothetical protein